MTHNGNLTDGRDQHGRRDAGIKPIGNRLGFNILDKLQIFLTDGIISECNEVERSINSSSSFTPLQRIPPSVQTNVSNTYGNDFMPPAVMTQDHIERPYKCNECRKTFLKDSLLTGHQIIRTREKLYKCDVCDKFFVRNSQLVHHQKIHGESWYKCNVWQNL